MRKILANLLTVLSFVLIGSLAKAQVTVTVDVPTNTTPNLAASYPSLADAVTAVNGITAMSGPVVLTAAAGTETAPAGGYAITNPLGTSAGNTITFNTSGLVTITANGALTVGALTDAIFKLIGADYITISGFTMQENAGNTVTAAATNTMTEWGVALLYATTTNGSQNCTIQNNIITLNRTYQNTFGIYSNSTHTATAVTTSATATTTAGGNSGLKIYGNSISNVNQGITVVGPTAAADHNIGVDIGGAGAGTANNISNYGTTGTFSSYANVSGTVNGILVRNSTSINVSYNSVTSSSGAAGVTAGTLRGIFIPAASNQPTGTYTNNINNNTVAVTSHVLAGTINGILVESTTSTPTSTTNINNNNFTALNHTIAAATGTITALSQSGTATAGPLITNVNSNTFTNITSSSTGSFTFISNSFTRPASGVTNANTNSIVTAFNKTGAGGTVTFYNSNGTSLTTISETNTGNNFSNVTVTGATTIAGWVSSDGSTTSPFGPGRTVTNNTFTNITGGTSAITVLTVSFGNNGSSTNNVSGNIINNIAGGGAVTGMTTIGGKLNFFSNIINTLSSTGASAVTGISSTSGTASAQEIYKNKIYDLSGSNAGSTVNGILISGTSTNQTINVFNNLVGDLRATIASGADMIRGISVTATGATSTYNVHYNTVYLNATSSGTDFGTSGIFHTASATSTTATLNLRNNIIYNSSTPAGTGLTVAYRRSAGTAGLLANYGSVSNYNDFYAGTPGASNLIYSDGAGTAQTIAAYKAGVFTAGTIAPRDGASVSDAFAPGTFFQSTTGSSADFLKYNTGISLQTESGAANIATYTDDYIGTIRQGNPGYAGTGTAPDMGAWELEGIGADLIGPAITYTPFANTSCLTDRTLSPVPITDASGVNTTDGTKPRLYFKKLGDANTFNDNTNATDGWKYVEATGPGGSPFSFTTNYALLFTGAPIIGDTIQYFVVAEDLAGTPNVGINSGTFAAIPASVALTAAAFPIGGTINRYALIAPGLSGTVNVGAAETFKSLTETSAATGVFAAINANGLSGNTTIVLMDASITETGATALNTIVSNVCSGGPFTLIIKPNTTTTLTGSVTSGALIKLNGADNVTIDGSNNGSASRDLTIINTATTAPSVIALMSLGTGLGATNNTIKNCNISTGINTTVGYGVAIGGATPGTSGADNDNTTIQNNVFTEATAPVYAVGTTNTTTGGIDNLNIINNSISFTTTLNLVIGMRLGNALNATVSNNTISIETSNASIAGISLEAGFINSTVNTNVISKVRSTAPATIPNVRGIVVGTGQAGSNVTIFNNAIYNIIAAYATTNIGSNCAGILLGATGLGTTYSVTTGGIYIYYNSINLFGTVDRNAATTEYGLFVGSAGSGLDIRNNIFANSIVNSNATGTASKSYAIYSQSANTAYSNINHNIYYASGTQGVLGFLGTDQATLLAWQGATLQDANSKSGDPQFISPTDLHINTAITSPAESAGTPILGINTDFEGDTRDGSTPDIGADEFNGIAEVNMVYVSSTTTQNTAPIPTNSTNQQVIGIQIVTIGTVNPLSATNFNMNTSGTTAPLTDISNAKLWYTGTSSTFATTTAFGSTVAAPNGAFSFTGSQVLATGTNYFWLTYDVPCASTIGNFVDAENTDFNIGTLNSPTPQAPAGDRLIVLGPLSGTYTVGSGGNYPTLTDAIADVNSKGLGGNTTFSILNSLAEAGAMTINQWAECGGSGFTLTIKPAAATTPVISASAAGAVLTLNGADRVTIDGSNSGGSSRDMTISNTNNLTATAAIHIKSGGVGLGATDNVIRNCNISAGADQSTGTLTTFGIVMNGAISITNTVPQQDNDNNSFLNNAITKARYGIFAVGENAANQNQSTIISNNLVGPAAFGSDQIGLGGIVLANTNGAMVSGNEVRFVGGTLASTTGGADRSGISLATSASWTPTATAVTNATVIKNTIHDIVEERTFSAVGIVVAGTGTPSNNLVANNMMYNIRANGTSGDQAVGIGITAGDGDKVVFNSIYLSGLMDPVGTTAATQSAAGIRISSVTPTNLTLKNNAIHADVSSATGTLRHFAIVAPSTAYVWGTGGSDNNVYYVNGSNAQMVLGGIGTTVPYTNVATLASWQTQFTPNQDAASWALNPQFISTTNLHINTAVSTIVESRGTTIAGVTDDFDGNTRNVTTPDIGADEGNFIAVAINDVQATAFIDPVNNSFKLAGVAFAPVASFTNNGLNNQAAVPVRYRITGPNPSPTEVYNQTGSIATLNSGETANFIFPNATLAATGTYTIYARAELVGDEVPANDEIVGMIDVVASTPLCGTYLVGTAQTAPFNTLTGAVNLLNAVGVSCPVIFVLEDAAYPTETFPVTINNFPGSSSTNTFTIRPGTGVTYSGTNSTALIQLNGCQYVTIDGRIGGIGTTHSLAIANTTGAAVMLINDAHDNNIVYTDLKSDATSTTNGVVFFSTTTGANGNDNNSIDNCNIGPNVANPTNGIFSLGTTTAVANYNSGNTVSNSNIFDYYNSTSTSNGGVGINLSSGSTDWTINNNSFYQTAPRTVFGSAATTNAILLSNSTGNNFVITNNFIGGTAPNCAGTPMTYNTTNTLVFRGIQASVGSTTATSIQGNTIQNIAITTASTSTVQSLISAVTGSFNIGNITGNTLGSNVATGNVTFTQSTTSTTPIFLGIHVGSGTPGAINVSNNMVGGIAVANSSTGNANFRGISIAGASATSVDVVNNTVGSNTTANSMSSTNASTTATNTSYGIEIASTITCPINISSNTVANLVTNSTATSAILRGIMNSGTGLGTISGNTIHDLSSPSVNLTVAGGATAVQGICQTGTAPLGVTISLNVVYAIRATNTGAVQTNPTGIGFSNPSNSVITRNRIYDITNASTMAVATTPPTAIGLLIRAALGSGATISNNMISLGNGQTTNTEFLGIINSFNTATLSIFHNTVNIEGSAAAGALPSFCFMRGDNTAASALTTPVNIKNNIFNNTRSGGSGNHYAIGNNYGNAASSATGWAAGASNNNALNSASASTVGYWNTNQSLAGWQTASAGDALSISGYPVTFTNTATADLHLNMGVTPTPMESGGIAGTGITVDYDLDTRPGPAGSTNGGATAPDMGADEFDGVPLDLFAPTITYTPLLSTNCTTNRTFSATIVDNSGVNNSTFLPRVYYKRLTDGNVLNDNTSGTDGWKFTIATNTTSPFNFTIDYSLLNGGTGVATGDSVQYFVVAQDLAAIPNVAINSGTFAATPTSVALTGASFPIGGTINKYGIVAGLSTSLTVGAAGDYLSLTGTGGLFEAINNNGLTGNTTVNILDATVSETGAVALNQTQSGGCGAGPFSLLIKPNSGVTTTLTGSLASNALIRILSNNVTLDGSNNGTTSRDMTVTNTSTTAPTTISLASTGLVPIMNTTVKNNIIINGVSSSSAVVVSEGTGLAGYFNNISILNNDIRRAYVGVYSIAVVQPGNGSGLNISNNLLNTSGADALRLIGVYAQGIDGATISNNSIGNIANTLDATNLTGIWLATGTINTTVSGNTISNISATTGTTGIASPRGIAVSSAVTSANVNITGNSITNITGTSTAIGLSAGIQVFSTTSGVTVQKNTIRGITNANTAGWGANGILLQSTLTGANITVANNMISDVRGEGFAGAALDDNGYGIVVTSGSGYNIYYNTVHLNTSQTNVAGLPAALNVTSGVTGAGAIDLRNNIFTVSQTQSGERYAIYSGAANTVFSNIDYNDYFTTGANLGFIGSNRATLADIVTGFGGNANSQNGQPSFISATDLHLVAADANNFNFLESKGIVIGSVLVDIDGDSRPNGTAPDIGADEYIGCLPVTSAGTVSGTTPLCIGATATYSTTGATPGGTWSSTNPAVASVNSTSGLVTALTAGSTDITYTVTSGCSGPVSAFQTLIVSTPANAGTVTGTTPLCIGQSATYTSNGDPGGVWTSTNTGVATVHPTSGLVTAVALGTTDITYTVTGCSGPVSAFQTLNVTACAPPNDDAPGAITLTLGAGCAGSPYTNAGATQGGSEPFAACQGTAGFKTVWYKFTAPASGAVKISSDFTGGTMGEDSRLALYATTDVNNYAVFSSLACDDDNGTTDGGTRSVLYYTGLTSGTTYYIQVDGKDGSTAAGTFCLTVDDMTSAMLSTSTACAAGQDLTSVNNNYTGWLSATDANGNLVALIRNPAGSGTSTYSNSININAAAVRTDVVSNQKYLDRNYTINNAAVTNVDVRFFFLNTELAALQAADPGVTLANLQATRQTGTVCDNDFVAANGTNSSIAQSGNGSGAGFSWIQLNTPAFSKFTLHTKKGYAPVKTWLQGAYSVALLRHKNNTAAWVNVLNANALTQPYNVPGFGNYAGTESVSAGFFVATAATTDVTDWVLLELRDATTPATVITRRAAFIREDGRIVDLDGVSNVSFRNIPDGNYFYVIRHRNHLLIRSSVVRPLTTTMGVAVPAVYDFSTSLSQAFDNVANTVNDQMVNVGGGVFGMMGGNANGSVGTPAAGNATIRASGGTNPLVNDYVYLVTTVLGGNVNTPITNVYHTADLNMDGTVRANGGTNPAVNDYIFLITTALGGNSNKVLTHHQ